MYRLIDLQFITGFIFLLILLGCDTYTGPANSGGDPDPAPSETTTGTIRLDDDFSFDTTTQLRIVVRLLDAPSAPEQQSRLELFKIGSSGTRDHLLSGYSDNALFERVISVPSHLDSLLLRRIYAGIVVDSVKTSVGSLYGGFRLLRHNFGVAAPSAKVKNATKPYQSVRFERTSYQQKTQISDRNNVSTKMPAGQVVFSDNMESGPNGWTHMSLSGSQVDNWAQSADRSASGQVSWRVTPHSSEGSDALQTPFINLFGIENAVLSFNHYYAFDDCGEQLFAPDGGRVEISNGNGNWTPLKPVGGYPYLLDAICENPLAGNPAYARSSKGWEKAVFDLSDHANQLIYLRFRSAWDCDNCSSDAPGWFIDDVVITTAGADSDNDGVRDEDDDFPASAERAFQSWFPGSQQFAAVACESDWPDRGDYDFNDLVMQYQYRKITNASGQIVALNALFRVQAIGCLDTLGFGVRLPFLASDISSFVGSTGTFLESSTGQAVLIVSNEVNSLVSPAAGFNLVNTEAGSPHISAPVLSAVIEFATPVLPEVLRNAPYDPFLFHSVDRIREVHMPDYPPVTSTSYLGQREDTSDPSIGRYYRTSKNMGWLLHMPSDWAHPIEGTDLLKAYRRFQSWAESGGVERPNWYLKDADSVNEEWVWELP
ncbi:MAG: LruC domain-containing protein [Calditrichia bacterium]